MQGQHALDEEHHLVVLGFLLGVIEVDGADGELYQILFVRRKITSVNVVVTFLMYQSSNLLFNMPVRNI